MHNEPRSATRSPMANLGFILPTPKKRGHYGAFRGTPHHFNGHEVDSRSTYTPRRSLYEGIEDRSGITFVEDANGVRHLKFN